MDRFHRSVSKVLEKVTGREVDHYRGVYYVGRRRKRSPKGGDGVGVTRDASIHTIEEDPTTPELVIYPESQIEVNDEHQAQCQDIKEWKPQPCAELVPTTDVRSANIPSASQGNLKAAHHLPDPLQRELSAVEKLKTKPQEPPRVSGKISEAAPVKSKEIPIRSKEPPVKPKETLTGPEGGLISPDKVANEINQILKPVPITPTQTAYKELMDPALEVEPLKLPRKTKLSDDSGPSIKQPRLEILPAALEWKPTPPEIETPALKPKKKEKKTISSTQEPQFGPDGAMKQNYSTTKIQDQPPHTNSLVVSSKEKITLTGGSQLYRWSPADEGNGALQSTEATPNVKAVPKKSKKTTKTKKSLTDVDSTVGQQNMPPGPRAELSDAKSVIRPDTNFPSIDVPRLNEEGASFQRKDFVDSIGVPITKKISSGAPKNTYLVPSATEGLKRPMRDTILPKPEVAAQPQEQLPANGLPVSGFPVNGLPVNGALGKTMKPKISKQTTNGVLSDMPRVKALPAPQAFHEPEWGTSSNFGNGNPTPQPAVITFGDLRIEYPLPRQPVIDYDASPEQASSAKSPIDHKGGTKVGLSQKKTPAVGVQPQLKGDRSPVGGKIPDPRIGPAFNEKPNFYGPPDLYRKPIENNSGIPGPAPVAGKVKAVKTGKKTMAAMNPGQNVGNSLEAQEQTNQNGFPSFSAPPGEPLNMQPGQFRPNAPMRPGKTAPAGLVPVMQTGSVAVNGRNTAPTGGPPNMQPWQPRPNVPMRTGNTAPAGPAPGMHTGMVTGNGGNTTPLALSKEKPTKLGILGKLGKKIKGTTKPGGNPQLELNNAGGLAIGGPAMPDIDPRFKPNNFDGSAIGGPVMPMVKTQPKPNNAGGVAIGDPAKPNVKPGLKPKSIGGLAAGGPTLPGINPRLKPNKIGASAKGGNGMPVTVPKNAIGNLDLERNDQAIAPKKIKGKGQLGTKMQSMGRVQNNSSMGGMGGISGMGGMNNQVRDSGGIGGTKGMAKMSNLGGMNGTRGIKGMRGMNGLRDKISMGTTQRMGGIKQRRGMDDMGNMRDMNGMRNIGDTNRMGNLDMMGDMNRMRGRDRMSDMNHMSGTRGIRGLRGMNPMRSMNPMRGMNGMRGMNSMGSINPMRGMGEMRGMGGMGSMGGMRGMRGMNGMGSMGGMGHRNRIRDTIRNPFRSGGGGMRSQYGINNMGSMRDRGMGSMWPRRDRRVHSMVPIGDRRTNNMGPIGTTRNNAGTWGNRGIPITGNRNSEHPRNFKFGVSRGHDGLSHANNMTSQPLSSKELAKGVIGNGLSMKQKHGVLNLDPSLQKSPQIPPRLPSPSRENIPKIGIKKPHLEKPTSVKDAGESAVKKPDVLENQQTENARGRQKGRKKSKKEKTTTPEADEEDSRDLGNCSGFESDADSVASVRRDMVEKWIDCQSNDQEAYDRQSQEGEAAENIETDTGVVQDESDTNVDHEELAPHLEIPERPGDMNNISAAPEAPNLRESVESKSDPEPLNGEDPGSDIPQEESESSGHDQIARQDGNHDTNTHLEEEEVDDLQNREDADHRQTGSNVDRKSSDNDSVAGSCISARSARSIKSSGSAKSNRSAKSNASARSNISARSKTSEKSKTSAKSSLSSKSSRSARSNNSARSNTHTRQNTTYGNHEEDNEPAVDAGRTQLDHSFSIENLRSDYQPLLIEQGVPNDEVQLPYNVSVESFRSVISTRTGRHSSISVESVDSNYECPVNGKAKSPSYSEPNPSRESMEYRGRLQYRTSSLSRSPSRRTSSDSDRGRNIQTDQATGYRGTSQDNSIQGSRHQSEYVNTENTDGQLFERTGLPRGSMHRSNSTRSRESHYSILKRDRSKSLSSKSSSHSSRSDSRSDSRSGLEFRPRSGSRFRPRSRSQSRPRSGSRSRSRSSSGSTSPYSLSPRSTIRRERINPGPPHSRSPSSKKSVRFIFDPPLPDCPSPRMIISDNANAPCLNGPPPPSLSVHAAYSPSVRLTYTPSVRSTYSPSVRSTCTPSVRSTHSRNDASPQRYSPSSSSSSSISSSDHYSDQGPAPVVEFSAPAPEVEFSASASPEGSQYSGSDTGSYSDYKAEGSDAGSYSGSEAGSA